MTRGVRGNPVRDLEVTAAELDQASKFCADQGRWTDSARLRRAAQILRTEAMLLADHYGVARV